MIIYQPDKTYSINNYNTSELNFLKMPKNDYKSIFLKLILKKSTSKVLSVIQKINYD